MQICSDRAVAGGQLPPPPIGIAPSHQTVSKLKFPIENFNFNIYFVIQMEN